MSIGNDLKIFRLDTGEFVYEGTLESHQKSYYDIMFEANLFEKTIIYYMQKVSNLMNYSTPEYVQAIHKILKHEENNISLYFLQSKAKYIDCIENQTITQVAETISKVIYIFKF